MTKRIMSVTSLSGEGAAGLAGAPSQAEATRRLLPGCA